MQNSVLSRSVALVIDDHPETLQLLIDALEGVGITVLVATDGKHALEQVTHLVPDLILLDAVMPGMDGFETCRALKSGVAADVPVIFMTGLEDTEHIVQGLDSGGIDYLKKPIEPNELLARMRIHLTNARRSQGARNALDTTGRTMLAIDMQGRITWATPQAQRMLAGLTANGDETSDPVGPQQLPDAVQAWIDNRASNPAAPGNDSIVASGNGLRVRFRILSRVSEDEVLLVLQQADPVEMERDAAKKLQLRFSLTAREAEVLYWLAQGKSNRDIAEILGMSTRTVDKHLEHVYTKVGVESRAGAAASAAQVMGD